MLQKKIILLVSAATLIVLSCIVVAFMVNNFINKQEAPVVKVPENIVTDQTNQPEPQSQLPPPLKETPAVETNPDIAPEQNIPFPSEKNNAQPAASQPSAAPILIPDQTLSPDSAATQQLPLFTPVTNTTGPAVPPASGAQNPQSPQADISSFVPQPSATGPVPQAGAKHETLPPFTPIQSTTGPVKTDSK